MHAAAAAVVVACFGAEDEVGSPSVCAKGYFYAETGSVYTPRKVVRKEQCGRIVR